jgi:hypothetical protein
LSGLSADLATKKMATQLAELLSNEAIDNARRGPLIPTRLRVVTGVPTDAMFTNPQDGITVTSTNGKLYYRTGGVWKGLTGV